MFFCLSLAPRHESVNDMQFGYHRVTNCKKRYQVAFTRLYGAVNNEFYKRQKQSSKSTWLIVDEELMIVDKVLLYKIDEMQQSNAPNYFIDATVTAWLCSLRKEHACGWQKLHLECSCVVTKFQRMKEVVISSLNSTFQFAEQAVGARSCSSQIRIFFPSTRVNFVIRQVFVHWGRCHGDERPSRCD